MLVSMTYILSLMFMPSFMLRTMYNARVNIMHKHTF
jgi:hypothetical protein